MTEDDAVGHAIRPTKIVDNVEVAIGPQFLELFSEQMYSSPNKAFEELISNSWDAGAQNVYVGVAEDLQDPIAAIWVLDDGQSMDVYGLQQLWNVANSPKVNGRPVYGRKPIGKFGIGKLSTYILAHELTFICKSSDGVIRSVTMDYRRIGAQATSSTSLQISPLKLDVHELSPDDLSTVLSVVEDGAEILDLINRSVPTPAKRADWDDEYGGPVVNSVPKSATWTLALCSSLKTAGRHISIPRLRRTLRSALPLGSSINIIFNGEELPSSKSDVPLEKVWVIGRDLDLASVSYPDRSGTKVTKKVSNGINGYPSVNIDDFPGEITGTVQYYKDKISGGISSEAASSNGFFVNVNGRVVNAQDPYFGLKDLNHGAWAKFRAAIRVDGFNDTVRVNREGFVSSPELEILSAFLRALFNKVRNHAIEKENAMPHAGDVLTKSWGVMPITALRSLVTESLTTMTDLPEFIDSSGVVDRGAFLKNWEMSALNEPGDLISEVEFVDSSPDVSLVRYDLANRRIAVNKNHPFVLEHSGSPELIRLIRDSALVELLTEAYLLYIGVDKGLVEDAGQYRDRALRLTTQVYRRSAAQIANLLLAATDHAKGLEVVVGDALECLGFVVTRMAKKGEPEGVAIAPTTPSKSDSKMSYRFTYDAKSSQDGKVQSKDLNIARLKTHRDDNRADYILVVAPDYQDGGLKGDCERERVTPMRAQDLARLLILSAATGPLDLNVFRSLFQNTNPDSVHTWVEELSSQAAARPRISLDAVLSVLHNTYDGPNAVTTSVIAERMSQLQGATHTPKSSDLQRLFQGLSVLVPSLLQIVGEKVFLSTSPAKIREAIMYQISTIPPAYRFGLSLASAD